MRGIRWATWALLAATGCGTSEPGTQAGDAAIGDLRSARASDDARAVSDDQSPSEPGSDGAIAYDLSSSATGSDLAGDDLAGADLAYVQPVLFDLPMIRDAATASCTFANPHTTLANNVAVDVWNLTYTSWESN